MDASHLGRGGIKGFKAHFVSVNFESFHKGYKIFTTMYPPPN